jgi:uncharacterized membrane protein YqiK
MHAIFLLEVTAGAEPAMLPILLLAAGFVVVTVLQLILWATHYKKPAPNEALIVTGRMKGMRILRVSGTFVWPILEQHHRLSLEIMPFALERKGLKTAGGAAVGLSAEGRFRVEGSDRAIRLSAERFLSKTPAEIGGIVQQVIGDHVYQVVRRTPAGQLDREDLAPQVREAARPVLLKMGLELVSFEVRDITLPEN